MLIALPVAVAVAAVLLLLNRRFKQHYLERHFREALELVEPLRCDCGDHVLHRPGTTWTTHKPGESEIMRHSLHRCAPRRAASS